MSLSTASEPTELTAEELLQEKILSYAWGRINKMAHDNRWIRDITNAAKAFAHTLVYPHPSGEPRENVRQIQLAKELLVKLERDWTAAKKTQIAYGIYIRVAEACRVCRVTPNDVALPFFSEPWYINRTRR